MYSWGARNVATAERFLVHLPAVDRTMLDEVNAQIAESGPIALLAGPIRGRPYKIYAVYAGAASVGFFRFLLVSAPARLIRFLLLTWLAALLAKTVFSRMTLRWQQVLLAALWVAFYTNYLWRFS